ncbi:hepatitis A virus cellular receptor 1 isoform X3 [Pipistrellus kuhlii]|uniref:hepatitis A virus cellular receptor 1 isoform X3 n=1 Tax=Pipistrellus kuhlii TaxID=59472 RepID=UPI001E2706C1|nr:hepatitis A virus cellular receptor 1 isoform X3 [Pipistrellus kuhlii]
MLSWVAFPSLILLWADVVVSQTRVTGVVGQTVMLPCSYSTARVIAPMCWGRGSCPLYRCSDSVAWTDGYRVTFTKDKRYRMNGIISIGNLSLTIENAALSDTGIYCCRIEFKGWFNDYKKNICLEIKPAPTTAPPPHKVLTSAHTTPATMKNLKTAPPKVTSVPTPPKVTSVPAPLKVSTFAPTTLAPTRNLQIATPNVTIIPTSSTGMISTSATATPARMQKFKMAPPNVTMGPTSPMVSTSASTKPAGGQRKFKTETTSSSAVQTTEIQPLTPQETSTTSSSLNSSFSTDGNSTVSQDCSWQCNKTHTDLKQNPSLSTNKSLSIGLSIIAVVLLLTILAALVPTSKSFQNCAE